MKKRKWKKMQSDVDQNQEGLNFEIASPFARFVAFIVEALTAVTIIEIILFSITKASNTMSILNTALYSLIILIFVFPIIYPFLQSFFISRFGGNFGKLLTGIKIVNKDGQRLSFWRAFFRNYIGYMISGIFFQLGFIWILVDEKRQSWHDIISGTWVVIKSKKGIYLGSLLCLILIFFNILFAIKISENIRDNLPIYQGIINDIKQEFQTTDTSSEQENESSEVINSTPLPTA